METPIGYKSSEGAAAMMGVSYTKFQRLYAKKIKSLQLFQRGPRFFLEKDIETYMNEMNSENE